MSRRKRLQAVVLCSLVSSIACDSTDGRDGRDGTAYLTSTTPAAASDCPNGGTIVLAGPDSNGSGALDIGEVLSTATICNGANGTPGNDGDPTALWLTAAEDADAATCDWGGTVLHFGKDTDGSEVLEPAEYLTSRAICKSPVAPNAGQATWTGAGDDELWSNPANWLAEAAPLEGQSLVFPETAVSKVNRNDLQLLFAVNTLVVFDGYTLRGNQLAILGGVQFTGSTAASEIAMPLFLRSGGDVTVASTAADDELTISGDISGPAVPNGLGKLGSGSLLLTGTNSYRVGTTIVSGRLRVDGGSAIPDDIFFQSTGGTFEVSAAGETIGDLDGNCAISLIGDLTVEQTQEPMIYSGLMSGVGTFIKRGPSFNQTLSGNGTTHTGLLRVVEGGLIVNGSYGASPVQLGAGALLGGSGNVGTVTVAATAAIVAGSVGPAILSASGDVTFVANSDYYLTINGTTGGSGYGRLQATGDINLNGARLSPTLNFAPANGNSFTIVQSSGVVTGTFSGHPDNSTFAIGASNFTIDYTSNSVVLTKVP